MNLFDKKETVFGLGGGLIALLFALVVSVMPAFADDGEDNNDDEISSSEVEYSSDDSAWTHVSDDDTTLKVKSNCISFSKSETAESSLESYEEALEASEQEAKESEEANENSYHDQAEHETDSVERAALEVKENEARDAKEAHEILEDEHKDRKEEHETKKEKYRDHKVLTGTLTCKTSGGATGFLPSNAAGSRSAPAVKKSLRELFGN